MCDKFFYFETDTNSSLAFTKGQLDPDVVDQQHPMANQHKVHYLLVKCQFFSDNHVKEKLGRMYYFCMLPILKGNIDVQFFYASYPER